MKDIKIVIGANFGDEGKGFMTNYFSRKENTIVVCSNGGAQRGHTVVNNNIRHVFHHFGSGTLNGAATYFSSEFIVNPIVFREEYMELVTLGFIPTVYMSDKCMITTPLDMMANQIIEGSRGENKHGSCGLGIYETIKRYDCERNVLDFESIRRYYMHVFLNLNIDISESWKELFFDDGIKQRFVDDLNFMFCNTIQHEESILLKYDNIVFEAGQGLLLDQNNKEYYPHLTPSNTGIQNPKKVIEKITWNDYLNIEVCYVTRTYMTRHGAGRFPSECAKSEINPNIVDKTNVPNPHQDSLRYGMLDLRELNKRCNDDISDFKYPHEKSIIFTHCNEFDMDILDTKRVFNGWNIYYSNNENSNIVFPL